MNGPLIAYVEAEIERLRALEGPAPAFLALQLERTSQLLRFTHANSYDEFIDRIEVNEEAVKAREYDRGWQDGRTSLRSEITGSPYLTN